jgi:molecular chaperone HtpG
MPRAGEISSHKMELDFDGLLQILAKNLYNKKDVFIRELIQNAHDACWRRHHRDPQFDIGQAAIDILPDLTSDPGRIIFRDNGEGMREEDLIGFLSAIGRSGTHAGKEEAPETIGQFGIGFLSGFVVGSRIEVRTRHFSAPSDGALLWQNDGGQDYSITPTQMDRVGTEVTITLKDASERGHVNEQAVRKAILDYADLLKVPIYVNDPHHVGGGVNTRIMPWERQLSEAERHLEYMLFLDKRVPDHILEIIPVDLPKTKGLLYLTKTRMIGLDTPPHHAPVFAAHAFV